MVHNDKIKAVWLKRLQVLLYISMNKVKFIFVPKPIDNKMIFCPFQICFGEVYRSHFHSPRPPQHTQKKNPCNETINTYLTRRIPKRTISLVMR